jgi:hypothetical protein
MAPHLDRDHERPVASGTKQIAITAIGAALLVVGSAIVSALAAQGWRWDVGMLAVLLIVEGIDCLYVGITGRNGASPVLLAWWQWP